jgi:hypothetical protein
VIGCATVERNSFRFIISAEWNEFRSTTGLVASLPASFQPAGGWISTIPPHFGQAWISPMIRLLRTRSWARHVSQITANGCIREAINDDSE